MNDKLHPVVGIDLGTTYSAVAVYNDFDEQTEIVADQSGGKTTPSVIGVDQQTQRVIVGYPAKRNLAVRNPRYPSVIEVKREMGEVVSVQGTTQRENDPPLRIAFLDERLLPQELSAFTLMKMKEIAENAVGQTINDAVITVPAYFNEKQRRATEEAALLAGLYPRQLIPEPTAAAICYGVDKGEDGRHVYLVYDLGGGTFDVSIIETNDDDISVIATSGDARLGGGDFDDAIVEWAMARLSALAKDDPSYRDPEFGRRLDEPGAKAIIKFHAERAKIQLSNFETAEMSLVELWPQLPPKLNLTRAEFNKLIHPLLRKSISYVNKALEMAESNRQISERDVDAVLLVGGSSKIRLVRDLLLERFKKDDSFIRNDVDPDTVVARGAALLANRFEATPGRFSISAFRKQRSTPTQGGICREDDLHVEFITEHSLGIGVKGDKFHPIIAQGENIPITREESGFVNSGPSESIPVQVFQGEGTSIHEVTFIGTIMIGPMEPKPAGHHEFKVEFGLSENGLLSVVIHHLNEDKRYPGEFKHSSGVGDDEKLAAQHVHLTQMYQHGASTPPETSTADEVASIPAGGAGDLPPPPPDLLVTGLGTSAPKIDAGSAVPDVSPPMAAGGEHPPTKSATNVHELVQIEDRSKIPRDMRVVVRSVKKLLIDAPERIELRGAYNAFAQAVNTGQGDIDNLGDELLDVMDHAAG